MAGVCLRQGTAEENEYRNANNNFNLLDCTKSVKANTIRTQSGFYFLNGYKLLYLHLEITEYMKSPLGGHGDFKKKKYMKKNRIEAGVCLRQGTAEENREENN